MYKEFQKSMHPQTKEQNPTSGDTITSFYGNAAFIVTHGMDHNTVKLEVD
jgi:hypothetical protein